MRSTFIFKIKRKVENFFYSIKIIFLDVINFFVKIFTHPKTEEAKVKVRKVKEDMVENLKDYKDSWDHRLASGEDFRISKEDI